MNKKISNHTRLHALTRQFIDICILAPLREPCNLRVRACKRVSYLLIFSFIGMYPVILISIKLINHKNKIGDKMNIKPTTYNLHTDSILVSIKLINQNKKWRQLYTLTRPYTPIHRYLYISSPERTL